MDDTAENENSMSGIGTRTNFLQRSKHRSAPVSIPNPRAKPDRCIRTPTIMPAPPPQSTLVMVAVTWHRWQASAIFVVTDGTNAPAINPARALPPWTNCVADADDSTPAIVADYVIIKLHCHWRVGLEGDTYFWRRVKGCAPLFDGTRARPFCVPGIAKLTMRRVL